MNYSDKFNTSTSLDTMLKAKEPVAVLAREAGLPFQSTVGAESGADPFVEWLSLMEVVHMLCPVWPVRDKPIQGILWLL